MHGVASTTYYLFCVRFGPCALLDRCCFVQAFTRKTNRLVSWLLLSRVESVAGLVVVGVDIRMGAHYKYTYLYAAKYTVVFSIFL